MPRVSQASPSLSTQQGIVVDAEDQHLLTEYNWRIVRTTNSKTRYAQTTIYHGKERKDIYLHRLIMGARKGQIVDHKNRNGLDCRRQNLRLCSQRQNTWNRRPSKRTSNIPYIGVSYNHGKWIARISTNGVKRSLGTFADVEDAARAYDQAVQELRGDYAFTNFPSSDGGEE